MRQLMFKSFIVVSLFSFVLASESWCILSISFIVSIVNTARKYRFKQQDSTSEFEIQNLTKKKLLLLKTIDFVRTAHAYM